MVLRDSHTRLERVVGKEKESQGLKIEKNVWERRKEKKREKEWKTEEGKRREEREKY